MSKSREIWCYDYVNHSYEEVRDALSKDALAVFQSATKGAASRADSVASALRVKLAGIEVAKDIAISVDDIEENVEGSPTPSTRLHLKWEATENPRLFPLMNAVLTIYPLTATETQLDFEGHYQPPAGALGGVVDSVVGHRIAEASVHRFVKDIAKYLRTALTD